MTIARFIVSADARRRDARLLSPAKPPRPRARTIWPVSPIPSIDALIEKVIAAETPRELTTACRALDRVFRAGRYWVPHWYKATHWIAYWDMFGYPPGQAALCARRAGDLVVRRRPRPAKTRAGEIAHERLYRPPHPADDSDAARHPVRLLRRGAVRAGRAGRARDRAALRRRYRRHLAHLGLLRRRFRRAHRRPAPPPMPSTRNTAARRGSIRISSRTSKSSSASTSRRTSASR